MARALVVMADGFEEIEAVTIVDVLRRAGVETTVAAVGSTRTLTGGHGIRLEADATLDAVREQSWDVVVLPGGAQNAKTLREDARVQALLRAQNEAGRRLAAICAAPTALARAGVLERREATCYPSFEGQLEGARVRNQPVVVDGHVTTSRGPGTAMRFALTLVEQLVGRSVAERVREQMLVT